jgi:hypothetical protein
MHNEGGDVNMAWMRWYTAKFGGKFMRAQAAYEVLNYPNLEPSLFEEEARWEQFYLAQHPEATDVEIAAKKLEMLQRRIHAAMFQEPHIVLADHMVNMNWLKWYAATHGCSLIKAHVEAARIMVRQGVFLQGASLIA